jgi:hypothetical protein
MTLRTGNGARFTHNDDGSVTVELFDQDANTVRVATFRTWRGAQCVAARHMNRACDAAIQADVIARALGVTS